MAIKWCTACDDPFCAPCWSIIHSRGKRSLHSHCTISPGGRVSTKAIAPDGTDAGLFTPGENLIAETAGAEGYGGGAAQVAQGYESALGATAAPLVEADSASMVSDSSRTTDVTSVVLCSTKLDAVPREPRL